MSINQVPNIQAFLRDLANKEVFDVADAGAPTDGTSGTGAGLLGIGSTYTNTTTGDKYINTGTKDSPVWTVLAGGSFAPAFAIVAAGTTTSGTAATTSIPVTGVTTTDIAFVNWRNAPGTTGHIISITADAAINVAFSVAPGTAGTLSYQVIRAL